MNDIIYSDELLIGRSTPNLEILPKLTDKSIFDDPGLQRHLKLLGYEFLDFQRDTLRKMLMITEEYANASPEERKYMKPICNNVVLSLMRQAGKSFIAEVFIHSCIYFGWSVLYTSYRADSATTIFNRIKDKVIKTRSKRIRNFFGEKPIKTGAEEKSLTALNGGKVISSVRSGGGRGGTYDVIIFDEAQDLSPEFVSDIEPTQTTTQGISVYLGTPPTKEKIIKGPGKIFYDFYLNARKNKLSNTIYIYWGAKKGANPKSEEVWASCNPLYNKKFMVGRSYRKVDRKKFEKTLTNQNDLDAFCREYLNIFPEFENEGIIEPQDWQDTTIANNDDYKDAEILTMGIKLKIDGTGAYISIAAKHKELPNYVEVFYTLDFNQLTWKTQFKDNILPLIKDSRMKGIYIDGQKNQRLIDTFALHRIWNNQRAAKQQGKISIISVNTATAGNLDFLDAIDNQSMRHLEHKAVDDIAMSLQKRTIGTSGFGFSTTDKTLDPEAIESMAIALYSLTHHEFKNKEENNSINKRKSSLSKLANL